MTANDISIDDAFLINSGDDSTTGNLTALTFIGSGVGTSTFTGGVYANDLRTNLPNCSGNSVLETDAIGAIVCGSDAGAGGGITSLGGQTGSTQTFSAINSNEDWGSLSISSSADNHQFTLKATTSPTFGYIVATSTLNVLGASTLAGGLTLTCTGCITDVNTADIALGGGTSGNYAGGDAEAGNALTGDSATAFFSSGTLEPTIGGTGQSTYAVGDIIYSNAIN